MLTEANRGPVPDGTLTRDIADSVAVTDFVRHKTIILQPTKATSPGDPPSQIADTSNRRPNEAATGAVATASL